MLREEPKFRKYLTPAVILKLLGGGVSLTGLLTLLGVLFSQLHVHSGALYAVDNNLTIIVGLTLVYLATLLSRGKRVAWLISLPLYLYIVSHNIARFIVTENYENIYPAPFLLSIVLPLAVLVGLLMARNYFVVKSETSSISLALRRVILFLLIAFLYGAIGFQLLEKKDFQQEIRPLTGAHYTVDQFGLTTDSDVIAHTRRAKIFLDSLNVISAVSFFYVLFSLVTPIKARLSDQSVDRRKMEKLLEAYPSSSEDFFKLWPQDKTYFFNSSGHAALAYKVVGGVALMVGDPAGEKRFFSKLLDEFNAICRVNDWIMAFIHVEPVNVGLYKRHKLSVQKIGEEAIVDLDHFKQKVQKNKYFRHIQNKFKKQGYSTEVFLPPHSSDVLRRLREISNDWLKVPGRDERGFMMGYFSEEYLQQGPIVVARDSAGTMQAFINQLPAINPEEANYDFLRYTKNSLGNINDFLVIGFMDYLQQQEFKRLNMGLCPLSGLDSSEDNEASVVGTVLQFAYANGDRFYSFSGLRRFKDKYEPSWEGRYIAYQGGVSGFSRATTSLMLAMRVSKRKIIKDNPKS